MPYADAKTRASAWDESDYLTRAAEMRNEFAELSERDRTSDDYNKARAALIAEVDDIDEELRMVRMRKQSERRTLDAGASLLNAGFALPTSLGEQVTGNEQFREWMSAQAGRAHLTTESPQVEIMTRALVTEGAAGIGGVGTPLLPVGQPYLSGIYRQPLRVADLLTTLQTTLATVPYVRVNNATTNESTASTVAEGVAKPEATIAFQGDTAPITVVAANIPVTTQILEDATLVTDYINTQLVYMLGLREEKEILSGNGIFPDLKGILSYSTSGNFPLQTQDATSGETAITLGNAMAKIEGVAGYPDGVVMNPTDAWAMITHRAASGAGTFDAGLPFASVPQTVWGVPVVRSLSLASGTAVVGSWRLGATLFRRQAANVRMYEQHSNFAVLNQVLIQAEERIGLAVNRPDFFVKTTIA